MIKLIASDLDGTLLQNDSQELQKDTCHLIKELNRLGILFVAASGRQYPNLRRLFAPVKNDIVYIAENGCLVYYQDQVLHKERMARALGQEILHSIWNKGSAEILLSGEHTSYIQPKDQSFLSHMRDVVKNQVTVVEDIYAVKEEYMKISVYEKEGIEKTQEYWNKQFGDRVKVVTSGNRWLDMTPVGAHKGSAIKKMQEYFQIAPEECMAFGDHYNDVEMLEAVQYSIAMDNAKRDVKKVCRYHTGKVETVLKKVIEQAGGKYHE